MSEAVSAHVRPNLGISAKSLHRKKPKPEFDAAKIEAKAIRYNLQRTAQSLMYDAAALKQHRVCGCSRNIASDGVAIYRTVTGDNARFSNLMTCGSVWACPVCAAKVTEARRAELQAAVTSWVAQGGYIALLTLTFPHENYMELDPMLERFAVALQDFKNSRAYKGLLGTPKNPGDYQRAGSVRSLEVTHGVNGWHPHTHDLIFLKRDGLLDNAAAIDELKGQWTKSLLKAGIGGNSRITDMFEHGLDLRGGDYAAEYIAKYGHEPRLYEGWSAASEVTKQHSKIGGGEHATPFMLLKWATEGDGESAALFKEFVNAFDGKRMNYWSPGLRKLLAIEEIDDDALAAEAEDAAPDEEQVMRLDADQWKLIIQTNARAEVLLHAARDGRQGVLNLLDDLQTRPKLFKPWFMTHARPDVSRFFH